jgi:endoribonuclease Dicer
MIRFEEICLLIFDEAHHCRKKHPYAEIMRKYFDHTGRRPRIFGMSACPVNTSVSTKDNILKAVVELERNMDSRVVTIRDLSEVHRVLYPSSSLIPSFECRCQ